MFWKSPTALKYGSISYSFVPWLAVCSCAFKRRGILNSKAIGLHRTAFKSVRVVLCAYSDLDSFQNRHCLYHCCCYLTFLYRATGLFHTENEDMFLAYRRVQTVLEKAFMQSMLWACSQLLLGWVLAQEDLSEWPVWSSNYLPSLDDSEVILQRINPKMRLCICSHLGISTAVWEKINSGW